jgi:hypothetical protein
MSAQRRWLAASLTFGVTLVLTAAFGSPFAGDHLDSRGNALLAQLIGGLRFPAWTPHPGWAPIIGDVALAVLVGALGAVLVSARTRVSALFAGWGVVMVLAACAGAARVFATHADYAAAGAAITSGLWFGLAAGWLNGVILACAVRKESPAPAPVVEAEEVNTVRIWTPTQPDWQPTQDMARPTTTQPWPPAAAPPA